MTDLNIQNSLLNDRYQVVRLLGRGSYSEIYAAKDRVAATGSAHEFVVIKALNVYMQNDLDLDLERTLVENFQNEALALDKVRHPNIISRLGHGTSRNKAGVLFHYLVLELMSGGDLAKLCSSKRLTASESLGFLEQICAGIAHAHKKDIIHRDIKPQNMFLTEDKRIVKIGDFGVARFVEAENPITRVGTNMYAPPEHSPITNIDSRHLTFTELTPAADIYSLAKTAYVLFTSETPRMFTNHPITELPFSYRQEAWANTLKTVLNRATQNDARNRYQTVHEFWEAISKIGSETGEIETRVASRNSSAPQPQYAKGYTSNIPISPHFDTSRKLKVANVDSKSKPGSFVVPIDEREPLLPKKSRAITSELSAIDSQENSTSTMPNLTNNQIQILPEPKKRKRTRNFAVLLILVSVFAGSLFATYNYLRSRGISIFAASDNSKFGTASTDINLRKGPNSGEAVVGIVTINSRVKILKITNNWYQVEIVEYGNAKPNAGFSDEGWVYGKYIQLDQ
ncbi:MAG: protein kinase domain-containing protein [Pyrinomonadaceae bacterium]